MNRTKRKTVSMFNSRRQRDREG